MRKLATIQKIWKIEPIDGADRIELAHVLGWQCVVNKGQFQPMDLGVYFEIDSFLPIRPVFEFMRTSSYRKSDFLGEGFRLIHVPVQQVLEALQGTRPFEDDNLVLTDRERIELFHLLTGEAQELREIPAGVRVWMGAVIGSIQNGLVDRGIETQLPDITGWEIPFP